MRKVGIIGIRGLPASYGAFDQTAFKVVEFDIMYGKGIDKFGCVFDAAMQVGVFTQKGAWVYYRGESFSQGREQAITKIREDENLLKELKELITNGVLPDQLSWLSVSG